MVKVARPQQRGFSPAVHTPVNPEPQHLKSEFQEILQGCLRAMRAWDALGSVRGFMRSQLGTLKFKE